MTSTDILIIGGGIAGASLGAELAPYRRVVIAEAEEQPGYHATGRSAAFWHEGYGGAKVAPLTRASRALLGSASPGFAERGFLTPRGAIHLGRAGETFDIVPGVSVRALDRAELEARLPGLRPEWVRGLDEPSLADIDVAALHSAYLSRIRRQNGAILASKRLKVAEFVSGNWQATFADGSTIAAKLLVNAAGAWADAVAMAAGVAPLGIVPKRRTMIQLRVARSGLARLPLVVGADGSFYFKGEGDRSLWLSPHDEIECTACDAAPEEMDIAVAIDRFTKVVNWAVEKVERSWAGLRTFAPDRLPVIGFDPRQPSFFWCAGQGGFGIQTAPAVSKLGKALILGQSREPALAEVDPALYDPARFG